MSGSKKLGWLAGGRAAGIAGCARWWGLSSPQWGQWVRRRADPRQTQCSGLQGSRGPSPTGGGDSAGPRTPTTPAPPHPLGAFGQQLVAKPVALRRAWAPTPRLFKAGIFPKTDLQSRKVHLLASNTLMQLLWCNHGMLEGCHMYTLCCPRVRSTLFNEYPVRHLVMRICASQCGSLLFYPVTLYCKSFRGVYIAASKA